MMDMREWLETNGLGGYASSTVCGIHTRRYHGLLVAALHPPCGRMVLLSKLEETAVVGGVRYELSANRYPGVIHPRGFEYLTDFRIDPFPIFVFEAGGARIEKRVFMVDGENTTVIEYAMSGAPCELEVRPLLAFRDYHATTHANDALNGAVLLEEGCATVTPYRGLPSLHFAHDAVTIEAVDEWYRNFEYEIERERGLDFQEDLFNPFLMKFSGSVATIVASTQIHTASEAGSMRQAEIARRRAVAPPHNPAIDALTKAAGQFIVRRGSGRTVIAGYHWFCDWGRDTMISLPGLTLTTGRFDVARSILLEFAQSVDQGMLPNRFPDAGDTPEYNTVDATLWFFQAVHAFAAATGDVQFIHDNLYDTLINIVDWHVKGTRFGIRLDDDGLLHSGQPGVQLTWMDAKVGDWVVTPRQGKPVEIQALWYNALRVMEKLSGEPWRDRFRDMADRASAAFQAKFWNEAEGCLFDVIDGDERDGAIRPNQIFAVSLPHSMLPPDRAAQVVATVERELLTPAGLRTLSPRDSRYRPRYEGGVWSRDSAYHQGTVWPWLMGPFITAYVKVHGRSQISRDRCAALLKGILDPSLQSCIGQIPEIADGNPPHTPRGCTAQAWSVAELLRAAVEDVFDQWSATAPSRKTLFARLTGL
jgi:predicted glycogen debranching enzyme